MLIYFRFQWVFLQIKQILELETERAIRDRLGRLPSGLKATYDEIYSTVQARHREDRVLADRAFKWVMCACTPLSSEELLPAIRLDPEKNIADLPEEITESQLLHLCSNLLVLDLQRKVWRFSHLSVTEYFEEHHWNLKVAHCYTARVCLKLLIASHEEPDSTTESLTRDLGHGPNGRSPSAILYKKHPLQIYSQYHWVDHVQTQEEQAANPALASLLKEFLGSPRKASVQYEQWHRRIGYEYRSPPSSAFYGVNADEISPRATPILTICRFSFYTLLEDWWLDAQMFISQRNSQGSSLLTLAAIAGSKPICETLVKSRIQVNSPDGRYGSALAAAAWGGNTETVRFLVQEGKAEVNTVLQTGDYGSALAAAGYWGWVPCVQYLLEAGAEVGLRLKHVAYITAREAAQADVRPDDIERAWWDKRDRITLSHDKALIAGLL